MVTFIFGLVQPSAGMAGQRPAALGQQNGLARLRPEIPGQPAPGERVRPGPGQKQEYAAEHAEALHLDLSHFTQPDEGWMEAEELEAEAAAERVAERLAYAAELYERARRGRAAS